MKIRFHSLVYLLSVLSAFCCGCHSAYLGTKADYIIRNANVITVNSNQPVAEAVAIRGEKIVFVGSNRAVRKFVGATTRIINAQGKTVMPGLYDSHVHSYRASVSELGGGAPFVRSIAEAQHWISEQVAKKPAGSWIILERIYATRLREGRLPTKRELDHASPNNPVHWNSGPVSVANSKALAVSGITRDTPNPTPGEIVRDAEGEPTGLLRNAAQLLKGAVSAYKPTVEEHRAALKNLHSLYNQQGITSIGERRADPEAIDLFRDLARTGELTVRVNCARLIEPVPKTVEDAVKKLDGLCSVNDKNYGPTGAGDDWVRIGPLKIFLDGGMLIGTAYMREPWGVSDVFQIGDPNYRGLLNVQPQILNPLYLEAAKRGWQLTAHCTGDASPEILLDCYEKIATEIGIDAVRQKRFLITHANFLSPEGFAQCRRLGISADIQPAWLYKDGASLRNILGERRLSAFQPLKSWFDEGLVIGGGSDHMVQLDSVESTNPWNPWLGIWIATTRQTEGGKVDKPEQRLTRKEALRFYTLNNAYLNFEEKQKGSLEVGKLADLIVLDRNILTCSDDDLRGTATLTTMVGGKIVWSAK